MPPSFKTSQAYLKLVFMHFISLSDFHSEELHFNAFEAVLRVPRFLCGHGQYCLGSGALKSTVNEYLLFDRDREVSSWSANWGRFLHPGLANTLSFHELWDNPLPFWGGIGGEERRFILISRDALGV